MSDGLGAGLGLGAGVGVAIVAGAGLGIGVGLGVGGGDFTAFAVRRILTVMANGSAQVTAVAYDERVVPVLGGGRTLDALADDRVTPAVGDSI